MPSFRIFSDLHLEFDTNGTVIEKCKHITQERPADYLILAGDIVNYRKRKKLYGFFVDIGHHYKGVFYVLGNHEYYGNPYFKRHQGVGQKIMESVFEDYRKICDDLGIVLLENESCTVEGVTLYGATLWSNLSPMAISYLNDKYYIGSDEVIRSHQTSKKLMNEFLERELAKTVVITHHLPSFQFIDERYYEEDPNNGMNAGFASNCEELFKSPISDWIFGHTHVPMNVHTHGINFWCNPHGYPNENEVYNDLVIQIV